MRAAHKLHIVPSAQTSPVCEATVPVPSSSLPNLPRWKRAYLSAVRLLTVAKQTTAALLRIRPVNPLEMLRAVFADDWQTSTSRIRRGYFGEARRCRVCFADVHDIGEMCPEQKAGDCSACGQRVLLDYWGCPSARRAASVQTTHRLSNILPATFAEWCRR